MCGGLEQSLLEKREAGVDPAMKQARRITKERNKKSKIGKKKEQAGDGNSSDADGLGGEVANMADA